MSVRAILALAVLAVAFAAAGAERELGFHEFYSGYGVLGLQYSETARAAAGKRVRVRGFAAPALKAEAGFFVLGRTPTSTCPYCNSDADWPLDIVVVYLRGEEKAPRGTLPVFAVGTLEIGSKTDPATGFVSQLRLVDAVVETAKW